MTTPRRGVVTTSLVRSAVNNVRLRLHHRLRFMFRLAAGVSLPAGAKEELGVRRFRRIERRNFSTEKLLVVQHDADGRQKVARGFRFHYQA